MQQYEDDRLQYYGRRMIPIGLLSENAIKNMRAVQKQQLSGGDKAGIKDPSYEDWLLVELTKWFNESFFEWVNALPCKVCGKDSSTAKSSLVENNVRVEVGDNSFIRFLFVGIGIELNVVDILISSLSHSFHRYCTAVIHKPNFIDTMMWHNYF